MKREYNLFNRIGYYREINKMTQQQLADVVGVRRETIVNLEKGKYNPSLKLALSISLVFNIPVEDIFSLIITETPDGKK